MKSNKVLLSFCSRQAHVFYPAAVMAILLSAGPLSAQFMVQPVNLAYLSQRADVILQGRVTKVSYEPLPGYPNIPSVEITMSVDTWLRGSTAKTYTYRELLFGLNPKMGKKSYGVGQHLLLFLPTPSQYGLSSPIGIGQGRFHITENVGGKATIVNEQGNAGLFRNVDKAASKAGKKLTASQMRLAATDRGPVPLDDFVSLVKSLTTLPRIR